MTKKCEVCGRTLRTGRKYCYEHRNQRNTQPITGNKLKLKKYQLIMFVLLVFGIIILWENMKALTIFSIIWISLLLIYPIILLIKQIPKKKNEA